MHWYFILILTVGCALYFVVEKGGPEGKSFTGKYGPIIGMLIIGCVLVIYEIVGSFGADLLSWVTKGDQHDEKVLLACLLGGIFLLHLKDMIMVFVHKNNNSIWEGYRADLVIRFLVTGFASMAAIYVI